LFDRRTLLIAIGGAALAGGVRAAEAVQQPELTLAFSRATGASPAVRLAPRGYVARLAPEVDSFGNVAALRLALTAGSAGDATGGNMLRGASGHSGPQPFVFAADDFSPRAPDGARGRRRVFRLRGGAQLVATVVEASVRPARRVPGGTRFQFEQLRLALELIGG
jgi:hypothetical protein